MSKINNFIIEDRMVPRETAAGGLLRVERVVFSVDDDGDLNIEEDSADEPLIIPREDIPRIAAWFAALVAKDTL